MPAACPGCKLVLVEADSAAVANLAVAVDTAAAQNPVATSNSYGLDEFAGMDTFAPHYDHPNTTILASSGDFGFRPTSYPAVLNSVVAAGGTKLVPASNARGWTETAWSGSGSGCSAYIAKPSWQQDPYCHMRTTSDISAVADPETGLAVYDTYGYGGWVVVGGTSLSSPLLAGMIGRSGFRSPTAASIYANNPLLFDAVGGSNSRPGYDCGGDYLCTGLAGYDAPTGLGTPNGTGVFGPAPAIANGGFETGTLSGWTAGGAATGTVNAGAQAGTYAARLGLPTATNGDSTLVQSFTAPPGKTAVSFWFKGACQDTVSFAWSTATLTDLSTATTSTPLARTCVNDNTWRRVTAPITPGHAYSLTLVNHDDNVAGDPAHTLYDSVAFS